MTKLKNLNCDKTEKSNCDKTQKLKLWQNSKTQIVTVVIVTLVTVADLTVVIVTSFSKNNLTPRQPMRCSQAAFYDFCDVLWEDKRQEKIEINCKWWICFFGNWTQTIEYVTNVHT